MVDRGARIRDRGLGGCVDVVGGVDVGVHVAAADEGSLALGVAEGCEVVGCGGVDGGVVGGCCGAGGEGALDAVLVDAVGGFEGVEGGFEWVGVGF